MVTPRHSLPARSRLLGRRQLDRYFRLRRVGAQLLRHERVLGKRHRAARVPYQESLGGPWKAHLLGLNPCEGAKRHAHGSLTPNWERSCVS